MPALGSDQAGASDEDARLELRRVVERWQQLPLDHALVCMPVVRTVVQRLADVVADAEGRARVEVPDLGPAVVMDQLTVMVYDALDASAAGADAEAPRPQQLPCVSVVAVVDELVSLRRALA